MSLIEKFFDFYDELIGVERKIALSELSVPEARVRLETRLERQQAAAEREAGSYGVEMFARAKYAMAALADEHLLSEGSPARETWIEHLLESAVFKSQRAGEKLFNDIDDLHGDRRSDTEDLARVYLAVLGLGFQGKYRDSRDPDEALDPYRRKLYRIIFGREHGIAQDDEPRIVPGAYASTLSDGQNSELAYLRPWFVALSLIFVVWLIAGEVIWQSSTKEILSLVEHTIDVSIGAGAGAP